MVSLMVPLVGFEAGFETPCCSTLIWSAAVLGFINLERCVQGLGTLLTQQ